MSDSFNSFFENNSPRGTEPIFFQFLLSKSMNISSYLHGELHTMRLLMMDEFVDKHQKYLKSKGIVLDPEQIMQSFDELTVAPLVAAQLRYFIYDDDEFLHCFISDLLLMGYIINSIERVNQISALLADIMHSTIYPLPECEYEEEEIMDVESLELIIKDTLASGVALAIATNESIIAHSKNGKKNAFNTFINELDLTDLGEG